MRLTDLPDVNFTDPNKDVVESQVITIYERVMGRKLADGDPVRLFILAMTYIIILLLQKIDTDAKMNLLKYSKGSFLEHLGALVGVHRNTADKAVATVRFTLSEIRPTNVVIPEGTRVTSSDGKLFSTTALNIIKAGLPHGDFRCLALEAGIDGNGIELGELNQLVDPIPYVSQVSNITKTAGGTNIEDDESYRERIHEAPESFSVAGPTGAYMYWAKTASEDVGDVRVTSPMPGTVDIYILDKSGMPANEELRNKVYSVCTDERIRPLTDFVKCKAPTTVQYDIDITYYIGQDNASRGTQITQNVTKAVEEFIKWQSAKMGRDINPSELIKRCVEAGAKRVEVRSPVFTKVKSGVKDDNYLVELAKLRTQTVNVGGVEIE
ncbi:baseplate J/gp47 family protein [Veillonella caviae]|uniref:baseplate assembly protein n=1 Tax=Veillonella caviae TaxID=248316 RepID=UPI002A91BAB0|nr:baseplate J/gp47 family protein [Veillonella caviae]MDY5253970.1 baseplate J/gp47 family protein [Veillonella caviae]